MVRVPRFGAPVALGWSTQRPAGAPEPQRGPGVGVLARLPAVHVDPTWVGKALDELLDSVATLTPVGMSIAEADRAAGYPLSVQSRLGKGAALPWTGLLDEPVPPVSARRYCSSVA